MNTTIATGHVMRCLSIADAARLLGIEVVFLLADANAVDLLQAKGYPYLVLDTHWDQLDLECDVICGVIQEKCIEAVLIDTYQVTDHYLRRLSEITRTVYIDDLNAMIYPVHSIICYANYWRKFQHEKRYRDAWERNRIERIPDLYLGCDYVPLRREFSELPRKQIKEMPENLLIMSGGTDPYDVIGQVLESVDRKKYREINVICGRLNKNADELRRRYAAEKNVHVNNSVTNMIDYMKEADLAVSAGGTTLYELCAVGTPTITYAFADNQLDNVKCFEADGLMDYAGDARLGGIGENVARCIERYDAWKIREKRSVRMQELVDGCGARRICDALMGK